MRNFPIEFLRIDVLNSHILGGKNFKLFLNVALRSPQSYLNFGLLRLIDYIVRIKSGEENNGQYDNTEEE